MGWLDTLYGYYKTGQDIVLKQTAGFLFRARTGDIDPWTYAEIERERIAADIQAHGPGLTEAEKAQIAADTKRWLEAFTKGENVHPDQAPLVRIGDMAVDPDSFKKMATALVVVVSAGLLFLFVVEVYKVVRK